MEDIYARRERGEKLRAAAGDGRVQLATRQRGLEAARADHERLSRQAEDMAKLLTDSEAQLEVCQKALAGERRPTRTRQRGIDCRQGRT